ncbi:Uncharacterised protein [Vibrio cholerae]|nr:Uncharacterised protein [Vibrio cholerae]CSI70576.1 Uncharacterised protein [Vibrio cholerae]
MACGEFDSSSHSGRTPLNSAMMSERAISRIKCLFTIEIK